MNGQKMVCVQNLKQEELMLSGKEALSDPLTELSLISHSTRTHYCWKQMQSANEAKVAMWGEILPI